MENQIIRLEGDNWKSLLLSDETLFLSQKKMKDIEAFKTATNGNSFMKSSFAFPIPQLEELSIHEKSEELKLRAAEKGGKTQKIKLKFQDTNTAQSIGHFIGQKAALQREDSKEKTWKPLLLNGLYTILAIGFTAYVALSDDPSLDSSGGSRKSRSGKAVFMMLYNTIGQTGMIIVGALASIVLLYVTYNRFKSPATETVYRKG